MVCCPTPRDEMGVLMMQRHLNNIHPVHQGNGARKYVQHKTFCTNFVSNQFFYFKTIKKPLPGQAEAFGCRFAEGKSGSFYPDGL